MSVGEFVVVLTTVPADFDAAAFASTVVGERLAACVNVLPVMESTYRWQGKIERGTERQLVIKTTAARLAGLQERIGALHPYDVPEVLVLPVSGGAESYLGWLRESCE